MNIKNFTANFNHVVSTVSSVSFDGQLMYETMVFRAFKPERQDELDCPGSCIEDFADQDSDMYRTGAEAIEGHYKMLAKWALMPKAQPEDKYCMHIDDIADDDVTF